ncbi:MAG TPA: hypothetical protein VND19_20790 [Acetobacteraceae bacterium]|nr:hypothetical protein [Acetobacteraceae bacterium]
MDQPWTDPPAAPNDATGRRRGFGSSERFRGIVALFGAIWLLNAGFQFSAWIWQPRQGEHGGLPGVLTHTVSNAPGWLRPGVLAVQQAVGGIGPQWVALGMVAIALLLGLSLIFRFGLRAACWLGIAYSLVCWVTLGGLGYPYGGGQTDPGVFPAYAIAFVFVLSLVPAISRPRQAGFGPNDRPTTSVWTVARLLFGLLWAFDAALKWDPYFLTHFLDQLTPAVQGQPAWIAAYIGFVIAIVKIVGPMLVAVVVALVETAIALSLLTGWWLRLSVPLGFLYSLAVWTTGEGWGGPYSAAGTGVRGDVLGNVLIYAVIFLFLLPSRARTAERVLADQAAA